VALIWPGAFNWISAQIAFIIVVFMRCEGANHEANVAPVGDYSQPATDQRVIKFLDAFKHSECGFSGLAVRIMRSGLKPLSKLAVLK